MISTAGDLPRRATARHICPTSRIDILLTDASAADDVALKSLQARGTSVARA